MQIPDVRGYEDPESESEARVVKPLRMAVRNSAAALVGVGLLWLGVWGEHYRFARPSWQFMAALGGVAGLAVLICFAHAYLGRKMGARAAGVVLKVVAALVLAGMLFGVWWSLRET